MFHQPTASRFSTARQKPAGGGGGTLLTSGLRISI